MREEFDVLLKNIEHSNPSEIERRSFEIISEEAKGRIPDDERAAVIKRVIHTTADFDYIDNLCFSDKAVEHARKALKDGAWIVTDTNMALAGINKQGLKENGTKAFCFMQDEDVMTEAKRRGVTRSSVCMEKAAMIEHPLIFAIGNAPTALIRLCELIRDNKVKPEMIIGVPVGFVNAASSKELVMQSDIPYIVARGRKGGSTVAACICNALLYMTK